MQEESGLYSPYKYEIDHSWGSLTYIFETAAGVKYEVYFSECRGDFIQSHLDSQTYTFGFKPIIEDPLPERTGSRRKTPSFDNRVKDTVIDILAGIIKNNKDIAFLYICSGEMERGSAARSRLFKSWLQKMNPSELFGIEVAKFDVTLRADNEDDEYMSLMLRRDNKYYRDYQDEWKLYID